MFKSVEHKCNIPYDDISFFNSFMEAIFMNVKYFINLDKKHEGNF